LNPAAAFAVGLPIAYAIRRGWLQLRRFAMRTMLVLGATIALAISAAAAEPGNPYAGQEMRAIKALSDEDIAGLLKGEGMGFAKAAELNGYPGPRHVLDLAAQLKLTDAQRRQVQAIFERMSAGAKPLGAELVDRERSLDALFTRGEIRPDRLAIETAAIAKLSGRLRAVHLAAHLETKALLTPGQVAQYQQLRGYQDPSAPHGHHNHG
jgi:Spy/CpxP family protein refolding chaperone